MTEAERLFNELRELSHDGEGVTRETYGPRETAAMDLITKTAMDAGLATGTDDAGNRYVILRGEDTLLPEVWCGSHLDSVPCGGNYDGAAGVVAGLLAMIKMRNGHKRTVRLVMLRGEESAWFGKCYLGSLGLFGKLTATDLGRLRRGDGVLSGPEKDLSVYMTQAGAAPDVLAKGLPLIKPGEISAFLELHIEQGPVLEQGDIPLGIVTGIHGNVRYEVTCRGEGGHSGTVPMLMRHDPVMALADLLAVLRLKATAAPFTDMVLTAGRVHTDASRDAVSIIPDVVKFSLEWRSLDDEQLTAFTDTALSVAGAIAKRHGVHFDFGKETRTEPAQMDYGLRDLLDRQCQKVGVARRDIPSGAGHDAAVFAAEGVPTAMLFVRNQNGSHNPKEAMRMDDFEKGVEVLEAALTALAAK
jgi:N-carbamoyl-L-amino-acid hydrolase